MRKIFYLVLLFLIITLNSCDDKGNEALESIDGSSLLDISVEQRSVTDCGVIPELCPQFIIKHEPGPAPGPVDNSMRIVMQDNDNGYQIEALDHIPNSRQFSVRTEDAIYVISDIEDKDITKHGNELIEIPDCIMRVFELDFEKYISGELSSNDLAETFGSESVTKEEGSERYIVDIAAVASEDCPPPPTALIKYDWCKWRKSATINSWIRNMFTGVSLEQPLYEIIRNAVSNAVESCESDTETCFDCINSNCVLDALEETPGISDALKDEMKLNYLILLLDLGQEEKEFLENNSQYLNDLLDKYGLKSSIGCDDAICGSEGADHAHINLLMIGVDVDLSMQSKLCEFYTDLYNLDNEAYSCFIEEPESLSLFQGCSTDTYSADLIKEIKNICGCSLGGTFEFEPYNSSNELMEDEPKWGNLGNCGDVKNELTGIDLSGSLSNQIDNIVNRFNCNAKYDRPKTGPNANCLIYDTGFSDFCLTKKYLYTEDKGWLDMLHVFTIFQWALNIYETGPDGSIADVLGAGITAELEGYSAESWQWAKGNYSAFSYEDLCSNHVGAQTFVSFYQKLKDNQMTWAQVIDELCTAYKAKEPSEAPNYDYIPHVIDEHYPKIFQPASCVLGNNLKAVGEANFCKMKFDDQVNLQQAHNLFPH